MNIEEQVFCIIHNYRRPQPNRERVVEVQLEGDSDPLESIEVVSTDVATHSEADD
jgi:hypothetical protein